MKRAHLFIPSFLFAFVPGSLAVAAPAPAPTPPALDATDQLKPIVPPMRLGDWLSEHWPLVLGLGLLALLAAGALVVWLLRRRRKPVPTADPRTPRQRADERLRGLRERMETVDARAFGNEACDILRDFLAAERRLPVVHQTSEEFLTTAAETRAVAPGEHALLTDFLTTCDQLKFARAAATSEVKERLLAEAADFVNGTAANRPPPLPPVLAGSS